MGGKKQYGDRFVMLNIVMSHKKKKNEQLPQACIQEVYKQKKKLFELIYRRRTSLKGSSFLIIFT